VSNLDLSRESPGDIVVTLRSLPRRFREALFGREGEDAEALARVVGPDGRSALDHVADTGRTLALLGGALGEVLSGRQPVLRDVVTDPSARHWEVPASDLDGELGLLAEEAKALADRIERVPGNDWQQVGQVADGGELTALDLAREAVRVGIDGLHATEHALAHARP
jgi:hypothetical protein